jgi:hypothetical protein
MAEDSKISVNGFVKGIISAGGRTFLGEKIFRVPCPVVFGAGLFAFVFRGSSGFESGPRFAETWGFSVPLLACLIQSPRYAALGSNRPHSNPKKNKFRDF